jgi:hypothetical protein
MQRVRAHQGYHLPDVVGLRRAGIYNPHGNQPRPKLLPGFDLIEPAQTPAPTRCFAAFPSLAGLFHAPMVTITAMSERDDKRGGLGVAIGLVLMLLFLPVLYVLSIGPAVLLIKSSGSFAWVGLMYYPLEVIGEACQPFDAGIRWYIELWSG